MADILERGSIVDKVVFMRVSFGTLGNTRKVNSSEVLATDADPAMMKVTKTLLDSPELQAIIKADGQIRVWLRGLCLPYDQGFMLLPKPLVDTAETRLNEYATVTRPALVDTFIEAYPSRCEESIAKLGKEYNLGDYSYSIEELKEKFYFEYQYLSFSAASFISPELKEKAEKQFQEKLTQVSDSITVMMRQTLLDLVSHLKDSLEPKGDGKPKRLFSSAITNIQEFIDTFKARNITEDKELDKIVGELSKVIHPGLSVDVLREDESFKNTIHGEMTGVATQLSSMIEIIPGRKFKKVE